MKNRRIALILLLVALLLVVPVYAQDEAATVEPAAIAEEQPVASITDAETATGLTVLILLLGVGAVGAVGGISILRERHNSQSE